MFGIGPVELIVVLMIGLITIGVPVAILVLLFRTGSSSKRVADELANLQKENQRLRDELARRQPTSV